MSSLDRRRRFLKAAPDSPCSCPIGIFYPGNYHRDIPHRVSRRNQRDILISPVVSKSDIVNISSLRKLEKRLSERYDLIPRDEEDLIIIFDVRED